VRLNPQENIWCAALLRDYAISPQEVCLHLLEDCVFAVAAVRTDGRCLRAATDVGPFALQKLSNAHGMTVRCADGDAHSTLLTLLHAQSMQARRYLCQAIPSSDGCLHNYRSDLR
jgi:hypothetical protein